MEPVTGRQYKSRKVRPCDFCRKRKVACHMEAAPPCQMCRQRQRPCTFALGPGTRTRPTLSNTSRRETDGNPISPTHQAGFQSAVNTFSSTNNNESQEQYPTNTSGHGAANTLQQVEAHSSSLVSPNSYNEGSHGLDFTMTQNSEDPFGIFDYDFQNENFETPQSLNRKGSRTYTASVASNRREAFAQRPPTTLQSTVEIRPNSVEASVDLTDPINQRMRPQSIIESAEQEDPYNCSLENISGASSRFIGFTGELDLYLLRHRKYDGHNRSTSQYTSVVYQRMQSVPSTQTAGTNGKKDEYMPPQVFTIMENVHTDKAEPRLDSSVIDENEYEFAKLISNEVAVNLVHLYYRFVDPYFPILSRFQYQAKDAISAIKSMPLSLLAAVCATAIPFIIYDDVLCVQLPRVPSVTHLFRISWLAITQELHTPRLSTIQACLLMLQRHTTDRYVADSPFKWTLTSITVAVAQNLGLNRDPSDWDTLAPWERKLRRRLWWAIWVMEKWTALGQGMPTHLHEADCDVDLLTAEDFESSIDNPSDGTDLNLHFHHLMTLTIILSDIVETYYTVKGVRNTANNFQLSLDLAKTARAKLKDWHDKLPLGLRRRNGMSGHSERSIGSMSDLDGNGALHLAYIVTQMTLFRSLLRPINTLSSPSGGITTGTPSLQFEGALAVVTGALTCIKELVEFIESLTGIDWDAFWHSWSRHNFAIASTFLMQLLVIIRASQTRVSSITTPPQVFVSGLLASHQPELLSPNATQNARVDVEDQYKQLQELVRRWRWAMRVSARGAGGNKGLMNLSLLRIDALFTEWQTNNTRNEEAFPKDSLPPVTYNAWKSDFNHTLHSGVRDNVLHTALFSAWQNCGTHSDPDRAYLIQNLSSGLRGMRSRAFATWYSTLGHHFAGFEAAWTPVPRLVGMATGRVLEFGPGSGNQLPRFDCAGTTHIYGIEPNEQLFNLLRDEIVQKHGLSEIYVPINAALEDDKVLDSWGIETGSIDTVVCMQVLCSVSDVARAAKQIHRLLKPGGQLLFWEHQASNDTVTRLFQRCWNVIWAPVIGGCHLSRDIEQALAGAGNWEIVELGHDDNQPWHLMPRVWGRFIKL